MLLFVEFIVENNVLFTKRTTNKTTKTMDTLFVVNPDICGLSSTPHWMISGVVHEKWCKWKSYYQGFFDWIKITDFGSVALIWRNTKCNVNPGLSHFEQCTLICMRVLANFHLHLHFAFCQSKATRALAIKKIHGIGR